MEVADPEEDEAEQPALGWSMEEAEAVFEHAQAAEALTQFEVEKATILDSIQSEQEMLANRTIKQYIVRILCGCPPSATGSNTLKLTLAATNPAT